MTTRRTLSSFITDWNSNNISLMSVPHNYGADVVTSYSRQFYGTDEVNQQVTPDQLRISELGKYALPQVLRGVLYKEFGFKVQYTRYCGRSADIFHCGDVAEAKFVALWQAYGLVVENLQTKVTWNTVLGHLDCTIDGAVVDCKSANDSNFKRYLKKPPDSYLTQVACYAEAVGVPSACLFFYNKNTSEVGVYYLTVADKVRVLERAKSLVEYAGLCTTVEDVYTYFEPPDLIAESYQKRLTGNFVVQYDLYDPWPDLLYVREDGISGYGDARKYVTHIRTPEEISELMVSVYNLPF